MARATLTYLPTREQLLQALTAAVVDATAARLTEADLDRVPVTAGSPPFAHGRAAGRKYAALVSQFGRGNAGRGEREQIKTMMRGYCGAASTTGRSASLTAGELGFLFGGLLEAAARIAAGHQSGAGKAAASSPRVPPRHREPR